MCERESPGEKPLDDLSTARYISLQSVTRYFELAARQSTGTATSGASELRRRKVLGRRFSLVKEESSGMTSEEVLTEHLESQLSSTCRAAGKCFCRTAVLDASSNCFYKKYTSVKKNATCFVL